MHRGPNTDHRMGLLGRGRCYQARGVDVGAIKGGFAAEPSVACAILSFWLGGVSSAATLASIYESRSYFVVQQRGGEGDTDRKRSRE